MNKTIIYSVVSFVSGAAISGLVVWKLLDKKIHAKYSEIADKEIESVKEKFTVPKSAEMMEALKKKLEKKPEEKNPAVLIKENPSLVELHKEYSRKIKDGGYTNYSNVEMNDESEDEVQENPFIDVIDPDEFGDDDEFDQISLTFYADGILADDDDKIIDDVEGTISKYALLHIGEYEDDAVHVKNNKRRAYYEVLTDSRSYEKATGKKPPQDQDEED
jgi:hypothetical protein